MFGDGDSPDNPVAMEHPQFLGGHTTNRARAALAARKERRRYFTASMFGESGWDMLLTLYIAESKGDGLKIGELTRRSGASPTTVLRWLNHLEEEGLVESVAAPSGVGPTPIKLTDQAIECLDAYFATIPTI